MSSANSSTGPGMGRTANAASPLSGFGIRPSRTRIFTARIRRRAVVTSASLDCPSERSLILAALEDQPPELAELRAVLLSQHLWRQAQGSTLQT